MLCIAVKGEVWHSILSAQASAWYILVFCPKHRHHTTAPLPLRVLCPSSIQISCRHSHPASLACVPVCLCVSASVIWFWLPNKKCTTPSSDDTGMSVLTRGAGMPAMRGQIYTNITNLGCEQARISYRNQGGALSRIFDPIIQLCRAQCQ